MEEQKKQKTTAVKHTETAKHAFEYIRRMYARTADMKSKGSTVAWCMFGVSPEIVEAFDIEPVYTENYATICAAKQAAGPFIECAEAEGYANVICGYARTGIGYAKRRREVGGMPPEAASTGGMADPDLLLACSAICDPRYKWYQALMRYMNTPYYFYDIPSPPVSVQPNDDYAREVYVQYALDQLRGLVAFLEQHTGRKLDRDRLSDIVETTEETRRLWWECYELRKAVPGPMPSQDMFSCIVPGMFMPSRKESTEFYRGMREELNQRIAQQVSCVPEEKFRLLWGGGYRPGTTWGSSIISRSGAASLSWKPLITPASLTRSN